MFAVEPVLTCTRADRASSCGPPKNVLPVSKSTYSWLVVVRASTSKLEPVLASTSNVSNAPRASTMLEPVPMLTLKIDCGASQGATLALTPVARFKSGNSPDTVRVARTLASSLPRESSLRMDLRLTTISSPLSLKLNAFSLLVSIISSFWLPHFTRSVNPPENLARLSSSNG